MIINHKDTNKAGIKLNLRPEILALGFCSKLPKAKKADFALAG